MQLESYFDSQIPEYAILSHVWGKEEISFQEMIEPHASLTHKEGYKKVARFCALVKDHGYAHAWVDACCIDKRSSAELSEAINSMFQYYWNSGECVVYLADVTGTHRRERAVQLQEIRASRWFSRGWTLQELIAPSKRLFLAADWAVIEDGEDLASVVAEASRVEPRLLEQRGILSSFCIAERMSWAAIRQTTRSEDISYSLLGIFGVNMPILYGEGRRNAFKRLQKEIMQSSFDQTLFAWRGDYTSSGLLANDPSDFKDTPPLGLWDPINVSPYSMTNTGLSINLYTTPFDPELMGGKLCDINIGGIWQLLLIPLRRMQDVNVVVDGKPRKVYRKLLCAQRVPTLHKPLVMEPALIFEDEHIQLVARANDAHTKRWGGDADNAGLKSISRLPQLVRGRRHVN